MSLFKKSRKEEKGVDSVQNLGIKLKSEFAYLFVKSNTVSTMKRKSHFLTRVPKENKDHQKIDELKLEIKESDSKERV